MEIRFLLYSNTITELNKTKLVKMLKSAFIWVELKMESSLYILRDKVETCFTTKEFSVKSETNLHMQFKITKIEIFSNNLLTNISVEG